MSLGELAFGTAKRIRGQRLESESYRKPVASANSSITKAHLLFHTRLVFIPLAPEIGLVSENIPEKKEISQNMQYVLCIDHLNHLLFSLTVF